MTLLRRGRFIYWLIEGLVKKYYKQIAIGLVLGILVIAVSKDALLAFQRILERKTQYIGVVGDYKLDTIPQFILKQISMGLTITDASGAVMPGLAASWEATDSGKTYTFHLGDAVFHDGKKVTADDINYQIQGVSMEKIDDKTVRFHLPKAYSPFLTVVTRPIFKKGLVGTGAYKVTGFKLKGDTFRSLTITPKDLSTKTVMYKFYKTEVQAQTAYKLGEVDRIDNIIDIDDALTTWNNTTVTEVVNYQQILTLFFNMKDPMLKEKGVRQALAYGVPDITGERAYSPIPKTSWVYNDTVKKYSYDEKQAKKYIDQTKIGTTSAELVLNTFPPNAETAQKIADSWTNLGIKTTVQVVNERPTEYQVFLATRDVPSDPDQYGLWHSTQEANNITGYNNPKIDKLLEDGRQTDDLEERKKLYLDFQKRLVNDLPALFLLYSNTYSIVRK